MFKTEQISLNIYPNSKNINANLNFSFQSAMDS